MAHKTKVSSTVYSIAGGKTKVSGASYSIAGGKTKIGGTSYGVNFGVTDLTNTYWKLSPATTGASVTYSLTYKVRAGEYPNRTQFCYPFYYVSRNDKYMYSGKNEIGYGYSTPQYSWYSGWTYYNGDYYSDSSSYQYIHITGGSAVNNSTLLDYFNSQCTQCDSSWNPLV